jgi:RHS repeat-associated protein
VSVAIRDGHRLGDATYATTSRTGETMRNATTVRRLAGSTAVLMAVTLAAAVPTAAAPPEGWKPPQPQDVPTVKVHELRHAARPTWTAADREVRDTAEVRWPDAGRATVDLPAVDAERRAGDTARTVAVPAGDLPISVAPASAEPAGEATAGRNGQPAGPADEPVGRVTVTVADRAATAKAGVSGLAFDLRRADGVPAAGEVLVRVDYSAFRQAYGGDWASRLRIVSLPDGTPLPSVNDTRTGSVVATVPLAAAGAATMFAATAGDSGDSGDFTATSLSPASTWQVSEQTGAFAWSYPLRVPPAVGGPEPAIGLSYSSGVVDGRTAGTNTQGSWVGDGWDLWPGFIERQYKACSDDKAAVGGVTPNNAGIDNGEQCWSRPEGNATISLNGRATELVKSSGNRWKGVMDDGSRIELLKDTALNNGDADGEYWKVTTVDGTQYFFGRNLAAGGASGATPTNSVWTTQVFGNHPNEPGYTPNNFAASRTTQAWRWNLDYVLDPHGNTMSYFYQRETGAYGREADPTKRTTYHRGGYLTRIEYGNRSNASASTQAAARILFDVDDRCVSNCWSGANPVTASWPDTPWDRYCAASPCTEQLSPTYWTSKRLSRIRAQVYSGSGSTYHEVEWWTLRHTYLHSGDSEGQPMWLAGVTRTGKVTSGGTPEVSEPEIVFDPGADALANRVNAVGDGRTDLFRYRIGTITTETGAQVSVTYMAPQCTPGTTPAVHDNNRRCYPVYYAPAGEEPTLDWFHKYAVARVDVGDRTGASPTMTTFYDYLDTPAWRYDDSELIPEKRRTWGQFRGWSHIRVRHGAENGVQSATEYRYFRGMHGDKQPSGTRTVSITDSQNVAVEDHEAYAGFLREQTTLLGAGGNWISGTINTPVRQGPTATSGPLKAWMAETGTVRTRTRLAHGGTRWTRTVTTFNSDNLPTQVDDLGDESTASDDRCIRNWYARNESNWMLDKVKRTETVGVNCTATPALPADMVSSARMTYDAANNNWDTHLPVRGLAAKVEEIGSWSGTTPNWVTVGRAGYDANGRQKESIDALGRQTTTSYTPASAGPMTAMTVTDPLGHSQTLTFATAWKLPVTQLDDANGFRTDATYDSLGRLLKVWLPGRARSAHPNHPDREFSYLVRNDAPTAVTTRTLLPSQTPAYRTAVGLFDGHLRPRQTQTQATRGGRVLTDTLHDSRGLVVLESNPYVDTDDLPPGTTLVGPVEHWAIPSYVENVYDGAERITNSILRAGSNQASNEKWRTVISYGGDRTNVVPPAGGTATTTIIDARGRTVELRQYKNRSDVGSDTASTFDRTTYTYTGFDELASMTDPAGNTWRYSYDQRGRLIRTEDPDRGITQSTYDVAGQLVTTTDARNITLAYTYDQLGRRTSVRDGSPTGGKRAEWVYDTLPNGVGKLTRSIRYEPAGSTNAYVNEITAYNTAGLPTASRVVIPGSEGGLCAGGSGTSCTYPYSTTYYPNGEVYQSTLPAAAGLPSEQLNYVPNDVGMPDAMMASGQTYVTTEYNKLDQVLARRLGFDGKSVDHVFTIDPHTGRLANATAVPNEKPEIFNLDYTYDDVGNLTRISDQPAGGSTDTQCFSYDYLRRLTNAWTPSSGNCGATRTVSGLGGPAPYWHSYTYDTIGNRLTETRHATTNTVRIYSHPASGGAPGSKPHATTQVVTSGASSGTTNYTYDAAGNMLTRPAGGTAGQQNLTWNPEGRLASVAEPAGTTSYVYDAEGNRLIRRDPAGSTLYLPGGIEVRKPTTGAATCTKYYSHSGVVVGVRTLLGLQFVLGDHHGTAEATVANTEQLSVSRRRTLPFGELRGPTTGSWPAVMDKGFVGGTVDNTGLTNIGAREYDPGLGRFISGDPIQDLGDPQQWHGYAYGNNAPATFSDPAGLRHTEHDGGGGKAPTVGAGKGVGGAAAKAAKAASKAVSKAAAGKAGAVVGGAAPGGAPKRNSVGGTILGGNGKGSSTDGKPAVTLDRIARLMYQKPYERLDPVDQRTVRAEAFCQNSPERCDEMVGLSHEEHARFVAEVLGHPELVDLPDPGLLTDGGGSGGHPFISAALCGIVCFGVTANGDGVYLEIGGLGWAGASGTFGYTSVPASEMKGNGYTLICGSFVFGACYQRGPATTGGEWNGGGVTFGTGIHLGFMGSWKVYSW